MCCSRTVCTHECAALASREQTLGIRPCALRDICLCTQMFRVSTLLPLHAFALTLTTDLLYPHLLPSPRIDYPGRDRRPPAYCLPERPGGNLRHQHVLRGATPSRRRPVLSAGTWCEKGECGEECRCENCVSASRPRQNGGSY